jgi:virulence-associated protein VagC
VTTPEQAVTLPAGLALEAHRLLLVSEHVIRAMRARGLERALTPDDLEQLAALLTGGDAAQLAARLDAAERAMHACLRAQEAP